jgi:hypothetical protein
VKVKNGNFYEYTFSVEVPFISCYLVQRFSRNTPRRKRGMNLSRLLKKGGLRPSWEFTTQGDIWRLHPASGGRLVGEERDAVRKAVSFFCLDLTAGKPMWAGRNFGEPWWTGIEAVHEETVIIHGFATPDLPEHRGVAAVDIVTGDLLWQDAAIAYWGAAGDRVYAGRVARGGTISEEIEIRTGRVVRELGSGDEGRRLVPPRQESIPADILFPSLLPEGVSGTSPMSVLLREATGNADVTGPAEYIDQHQRVVFSYYERGKDFTEQRPVMVRRICVVDASSRRMRGTMVLDHAVVVPMPDTFLVRDGVFYAVRERKTLCAVRLFP